ncbi:MAG: hypothetical protein ACK4TR_08945 [Phenylobacterium sp.]|uniref:hypothetical protein n=1 Tax=Phenylobacterium sp. TaxID=1871053 RepID=UPI00391AE6C1
MRAILTILKHVSTTRDGESYDVVRVGMVLSGAALILFTGWDVIAHRAAFDPLNFGAGVAAILFGGGAGIGAKRKDEPDPSL